jgi:hypothetical protein
MASAASVTCNSFQVSRLHIWLCRVRLCTNKLTLEAMACVFYTHRQVLTLIHHQKPTSFNCVCLSVS